MASERSPDVETSSAEHDGKRVDEFFQYLTGPNEEPPFRNYSIRTRHLDSCAFRLNGPLTFCSCCVGSMTFSTAANALSGMLQQLPLALIEGLLGRRIQRPHHGGRLVHPPLQV